MATVIHETSRAVVQFFGDFFGKQGYWTKDDGGFCHTMPSGEPRYDSRYDAIGPFSEGLAWASAHDECFHINEDGLPAYPQRYDCAGNFVEGTAAVELNGRHFHIKPDGTPAYPQRYSWVSDFYHDPESGNCFAWVLADGDRFQIKSDGTRV